MRTYQRTRQKRQLVKSEMSGWIKLLNTLVSNTQIKPNELAEAVDIQAVEDGKIQCPRDGQAYYGASSGDKVTGLFPYYKSDGTNELLRSAGTALQKYVSGTWSNVSGKTYTDGLDTNGVMAYDRLYLCNGTDPLTYYDGTSITTFTEIDPPTISSVARTGTDGTYTFSYKVTAVTAVGESEASEAVSQTINVDKLDDSSYMTVNWGAVTGALGYNVYGRKDGSWYFLVYVEGNGSNSWVDKGSLTPYEVAIAPSHNSTGGVIGKYIAVYKDSLFIAGDPNDPSRLYYSGGGDKVNSFSVSDGGGLIDIAKNDGQKITGMIVFKDALLVFKERSIYKFNFNVSDSDALPQIELINPAIGCIAPRSIIAVENDVFFASDRGIFTIGNEAGFAFDVLRTNELSAKVRSIFQSISPSRLPNISAVYATKNNANLVIFAFTPTGGTYNSQALVYDRERLGWYKWTNIQANCWAQYYDSNNNLKVLYGDDNSGYVKEILTGSDDFGTAIRGRFRLKAESFKQINQYKKLKDLDIVVRKPTGSITVKIIKDGVETVKTLPIATLSPSINWGHYLFSSFTFGDSFGTGVITEQDNNLLKTYKNLNIEGRSFMLEFDNNGTAANFTLLFAGMSAKPRGERYRRSVDLLT
jgi:hypothetical protein